MSPPDQSVIGLAVALAVGMLIGLERERHKGRGTGRAAAGIRTFTLIALSGAISMLLASTLALAVFGIVLGILVAISYLQSRRRDPGLTTEIAMLVAFLLGGLSMHQPQLSAALAVVVTIILAARTRMHDWIHDVLTDQEVRSGLTLAAAALVILPLTPTEPVDPWGIIAPRQLWLLAVLVMTINSVGYIALRALGPKVGLALAGLFSGFVSSTATIAALGSKARTSPELHRGAVAGAAASSVATVIRLALLIALTSLTTLLRLAPALIGAGIAAVAYAGLFTLRSARETSERESPPGRPFDPKTAIVFVLLVGTTLVVSALLTQWLGDRGLLIASAAAGFGDTHSPAISAAALAAAGSTSAEFAAIAVLAAFSTNTLSKSIVAFTLGGRRYALELLPGLVLMLLAAWGGWFLSTLLS